MTRFMRRPFIFSAGVLVLALAACASLPNQIPPTEVSNIPTATSAIPITGTDLVNTQWVLVAFGEAGTETPVLQETNVTLEFQENGQAGGTGGCNTFGTQYQIQNSTIVFQQIISTTMACTTAGATEQEQKYFNALQSANRFE